MENNNQTIHVKHITMEPSALGLFGLAMVTLVASSQKLELTHGVAGVLPWAIFLGAIAQLIAAAYDAKHDNTFGATAFFAYGLFWLGVGMTWLISNGLFGEAFQATYDPHELAFAYVGYFIFTMIMTIASTETSKLLFIIFCLIDVLFLGLFLTTFGVMEHATHMLAAFAELAIAIASFYGVAANILNHHFGYKFLPVGKPFGIFKKHN